MFVYDLNISKYRIYLFCTDFVLFSILSRNFCFTFLYLFFFFSRIDTNPNLCNYKTVSDVILEIFKKVKYLRVILDNKLRWKSRLTVKTDKKIKTLYRCIISKIFNNYMLNICIYGFCLQ